MLTALGYLIGVFDLKVIRSEYAHIMMLYNSPFKRFLLALGLAAILGLLLGSAAGALGAPESAALTFALLSGVIIYIVCINAISAYRKDFISCPECKKETQIVEDNLLTENTIGERKKDSSGKLKIEHYRVGTRQVKIACKACDYTKTYELKFKERT